MKLRRPLVESRRLLAAELGIYAAIIALLYVFRDRNPIGVLSAIIILLVGGAMLGVTIRGILGALPKPDQSPKPSPPGAGEGRDG